MWIAKRSPSPNIKTGRGPYAIEAVIHHYTASRTTRSAIEWLTNPHSNVSAHFIVGRDGEVSQLVDTNDVAWHAGGATSRLFGKRFTNSRSVGVEWVNRGPLTGQDIQELTRLGRADDIIEAEYRGLMHWERFPDEQLQAGARVLAQWIRAEPAMAHLLERSRHLGHQDVDDARKMDPGPAFDYDRFHAYLLEEYNR